MISTMVNSKAKTAGGLVSFKSATNFDIYLQQHVYSSDDHSDDEGYFGGCA